jgi:hypothetical protein
VIWHRFNAYYHQLTKFLLRAFFNYFFGGFRRRGRRGPCLSGLRGAHCGLSVVAILFIVVIIVVDRSDDTATVSGGTNRRIRIFVLDFINFN